MQIKIFLLFLLNLSKCTFGLIHLALNETQFRNALEIVNPGDTIQLGLPDFIDDWFGRFEISRNGTTEKPIILDIVGIIVFRSDDTDPTETLFTISASHWRIGGYRFYLITNSQPALKLQNAHHNYFSRIDLTVTNDNQIALLMDNSHMNEIYALYINKDGDGIGLNLEKSSRNLFTIVRYYKGRVLFRNSDQNHIYNGVESFALILSSSSQNLIENSHLLSLTIDSSSDQVISTKNIIKNNVFSYDWTDGEVDIPKFAIHLKNTSCCGQIDGNYFSGVNQAFPLTSFILIEGNNYEFNQNEGSTIGGYGFLLGDSVNYAIFRNNWLTIANSEKFCIHGNPQIHSANVCIEPDNSCQFAQLSNFESGDCPYEETTITSTETTIELITSTISSTTTETLSTPMPTTQPTTKIIDTTQIYIQTTPNSATKFYFIPSLILVFFVKIFI